MPWRRFFRRADWDRERSAEIESYIQIETDENVARGMALAEARAAARRKFGNPTLVREEIYRMNTLAFLDNLARDARYALRALRRNPTFSIVAVLTLAIGVGANTAVFSVVNSVLLHPLPYPKSEQLVVLNQEAPGAAGLASFSKGLPLSTSMYYTYAEQNRSFQNMGVWLEVTANVTGLAEPEQVRVTMLSDGLLEALDVPPAAGRWLSRADQTPHGPERVMLSYAYWQRHFGGLPSAIGRNLIVDSRPREIVGVMPRGFRIADAEFDLLAPFQFERNKSILAGFGLLGIARLKPGVTISEANADLARLIPIWRNSWNNGPGTNGDVYKTWRITPALHSLKQEVVGGITDVLWIVMATIGLVMLVACANVTSLLLVRAEIRQSELALRSALGAARGRIMAGLLVESFVLGLISGIVGVGIAAAGLRLLEAIGPANLPRLAEISIDFRTLGFALLLSLLSGLLLGLIPAWKYAGPRISAVLRSAGRTASLSRERHRVRNLLVIAQVAMALVLLVSAGLMIRSFLALRTVDPGFTQPRHLQAMRINIPASLVADRDRVIRIENGIVDKLSAIPGVTAVGFADEMPMEGYVLGWDEILAEDHTYPRNQIPPLFFFKYVSPGFFHAAGTRVMAGRELTWTDIYNRSRVVLLSDNLARELWGSPAAAVGKHIRELPNDPWSEVVGVVQNVREKGVDQNPPKTVYWGLDNPFIGVIRTVTFVIRSDRAGTQSFLNEVRQAVWSVNANLPVASLRTMQAVYDESLARTSFTLVMLAIAGSMALLLGVIGIYGVISYAVSQRRREIGIRLALGAEQGALRRMFVRHALLLAAIGVTIGIVASAALTGLMKSLLFGISPLDPLTYAVVPIVLVAATVLASYLPARRAAAVDPVETLRAE
jgi:putative ABC transport system permease protein